MANIWICIYSNVLWLQYCVAMVSEKGYMKIDVTRFFKCLSEQLRLDATLLIYQQGELCVCELVAALGESQPKISRHLAQLRSAGVLVDRRQGQWVYYAINPKLADWALAVLDEAGKVNHSALNALTKKLNRMKDRPNCC